MTDPWSLALIEDILHNTFPKRSCGILISVEGSVKESSYLTYFTLKIVSALSYQIFIFSPNKSPLKTMKNVFYFI